MNAMPAHFRTLMGAPGCAQAGGRRSGPQMLDGRDGPARLVFESGDGLRYVAQLDRWLLIVRFQPPARGASRVLWLLDAGTLRWSGALPPARGDGEGTGPRAEKAPVLWFRAGESADRRCSFTASGVFGATGIVDAAQVRVSASRLRRQVRLRMSIDTSMWDRSLEPALPGGTARVGRLTITAAGRLRALEPQATESWQ